MSGSLLLESGHAADAFPRLAAAVQQQPRNGELLQVYANACLELGHWQEAAIAYQMALEGGRRNPHVLNNLGLALKELGQVDAAIARYRESLELSPDDPDVYNNLAIALNRNHDYVGAMAAYRRSTELAPGNAEVWSNLAMLYEQSNMLDEAEQALQQGLTLSPGQENLELIAARCARRRGDTPATIVRLEQQLPRRDLTPMVRRSMEFELGRAYDMQGEPDPAYRHLLAGNQLTPQVWPGIRAGAEAFLRDLDANLAFFRGLTAPELPVSAPESRRSPVFLVGFPRSGTTLMDTILDAHPGVSVLEEEVMLGKVIEEMQGRPGGYPGSITTLKPEDIQRLRDIYWREADALQGTDKRELLLLDKNPFHSSHAGFIRLLFPGARFIFALRHPCDVVFSCFMQAFGNNAALENFRNLEDAAAVYRRVMDLWKLQRERLKLDVHVLRYESLIKDKDTEVRALLEFLGLEWEEGLQDHTRQAKKRGRIYTPSYHQVIKPIYGDAVGRWQRYRGYFGEALPILAPYAADFGYALD
jgi:Flp pilus assembly protein TadD